VTPTKKANTPNGNRDPRLKANTFLWKKALGWHLVTSTIFSIKMFKKLR